jgi:hypothetical protein
LHAGPVELRGRLLERLGEGGSAPAGRVTH